MVQTGIQLALRSVATMIGSMIQLAVLLLVERSALDLLTLRLQRMVLREWEVADLWPALIFSGGIVALLILIVIFFNVKSAVSFFRSHQEMEAIPDRFFSALEIAGELSFQRHLMD